jgi:hypothetical protein
MLRGFKRVRHRVAVLPMMAAYPMAPDKPARSARQDALGHTSKSSTSVGFGPTPARLNALRHILAPVVLALQPTEAAAQAQLAPVQPAPSYERQQTRINSWTVGLAAGLIGGASLRPSVERAHVVDDGTNLHVLPFVRLGTMERLYLRGADLAIVNSGACALLAQAERLECLEKLSRDIAPRPPSAVTPSPD